MRRRQCGCDITKTGNDAINIDDKKKGLQNRPSAHRHAPVPAVAAAQAAAAVALYACSAFMKSSECYRHVLSYYYE